MLRNDLLLIVDQSDPCLRAADDDPRADRTCFFADRRQERVAGALDLPVPAPRGKEKAVPFSVRKGLTAAADASLTVQDQNTEKGRIVGPFPACG